MSKVHDMGKAGKGYQGMEQEGKKVSILIKGIKMPTTCTRCTLDAFGYCVAARRYSESSTTHERASFCPLVELPEKHGRLIDADALIAKCGDWYTEEGKEEGFIGTLEMLL